MYLDFVQYHLLIRLKLTFLLLLTNLFCQSTIWGHPQATQTTPKYIFGPWTFAPTWGHSQKQTIQTTPKYIYGSLAIATTWGHLQKQTSQATSENVSGSSTTAPIVHVKLSRFVNLKSLVTKDQKCDCQINQSDGNNKNYHFGKKHFS